MSRTNVKYVAVVVVGLVLISALWRGYSWWTHPTLLSNAQVGGSGRAATKPVAEAVTQVGVAGEPWRKPFGDPPSKIERITFHGARTHFRNNTAGADVTFSICHAKRPDSAIGVVDGELSPYCTSVRPLRDGTVMRFGSPEYVVATVTPTTAGEFDIDYVTLDYSRPGPFGQHGNDKVYLGYSGKVTE